MPMGPCKPPQPEDPTCPKATLSIMIPIPGLAPTSCCTPGGLCGLDGSAFGMDCVDFDTVKANPMVGGIIMVPPAKGCGPNPAPVGGMSGGAGMSAGGTGGSAGAAGAAGRGGAGGAAGAAGAAGRGGAGGAGGRGGAGGS
jgi:hypothetical protein